VSPAE